MTTSWEHSRRAERRADHAAAAERARADQAAALERRLREQAARDDRAAGQREQRRAVRDATAAARRERASARRTAVTGWACAHRVELLVYPLAAASAVMAVPAMAGYGIDLYAGPTGAVLPVLSELGMWAFALAVGARRRADPDAPLAGLRAGVWTFAAVAAVLNFLHGNQTPTGPVAGLVMAIVSVAGVIAHQLLTAGARRTRAERDAARTARERARRERALARRVAVVERVAVREMVAHLDAQGRARLEFPAGYYGLTRTWAGRRRLAGRTVAGLPVTDAGTVGDGLADEITAWLATDPDLATSTGPNHTHPDEPHDGPDDEWDEGPGTAGVGTAVLDPPPDDPGPEAGPGRGRHRAPRTRSLDELRAEFRAALSQGRLNPTSAESIRKTLRCAPGSARALRDEHTRSQDRTKGGDQ